MLDKRLAQKNSNKSRYDEQAERSRADLNRLNEQSEKLFGAPAPEGASDQDDAIEIWGKRIGRGLGVVFVMYLIWHLMTTYVIQ